MKAAIFLREVLTFVFGYNVELIVLWAFQGFPRLFPASCMSRSLCPRILCNHAADPSCLSYFISMLLPRAPFNLAKCENGHILC